LVAVKKMTGEFSMPWKAKVIVNYIHSQLNRFEDWSITLNPNGEGSKSTLLNKDFKYTAKEGLKVIHGLISRAMEPPHMVGECNSFPTHA